MSRIGLFCFLGSGHLNPAAALGRGLQARGHEVTVFHITIAQAAVQAAGLKFYAIDQQEPRSAVSHTPRRHEYVWTETIQAIEDNARRVLREAPTAIRGAEVDALVIDQLDLAASSVAESLGLPFVSLSCTAPIFLHPDLIAPYFSSHTPTGYLSRFQNELGNRFIRHLISPTLEMINEQRALWGLRRLQCVNEVFSDRVIITQLPAVFELPSRSRPSQVMYTGPWRDERYLRNIAFPWDRLNGKPLVYASMGTIRNNLPWVFRTIAEACSPLDFQLVLSLGGGTLFPEHIGNLPGNPIVVHYAPQMELLRMATLTINCAGLNTTLDCILNGVPIVAIPVAEDQPGIGTRIERSGVGAVVPLKKLSVARLRETVSTVLREPHYRESVLRYRTEISRLNGVRDAVHFIERSLFNDQWVGSYS